MNVSLRQLKAFLGVAESGNFTKTAQRLHLSQAALSATIRELESQLRSRLFDRTTRAVELTEAGRAFWPTATLIVQEMESAAVRVKELERKDVSEISLGFTPLMASHVLPEVLERFAALAPAVAVDVVDASPLEIQQLVESGAIDAAYGAFFAKASGLRQQPILPSRLMVACALSRDPLPEHFGWHDLADEALISLQPDSPVQQLVDAALLSAQLTPRRRFTVNQLETAIALAEKDFGVAVIPSFAAAACRRYAVRVRPIVPSVAFEFSQISRAGRTVSPAIEGFARLFAEVTERFASGLAAHA
jgi:DNA-binding transcriptional LysR family regulator